MERLELLFEKVEDYAKTSLELFKLRTIDKSASIISSVVYGGIMLFLLSVFFMGVNVGASIWLGEILGKMYYGFLCVGGFYGIMGIIVCFFMRKSIKKWIGNFIVTRLLN
ncbi:MAG: hypothetical protein RBS19_01415 [Bacteroidales bacterium]|nr:hypothetical protein [Bacteroidales bacterium]